MQKSHVLFFPLHPIDSRQLLTQLKSKINEERISKVRISKEIEIRHVRLSRRSIRFQLEVYLIEKSLYSIPIVVT